MKLSHFYSLMADDNLATSRERERTVSPVKIVHVCMIDLCSDT